VSQIPGFFVGFTGTRFYDRDKMSKSHSAVNKVLPEFEDVTFLKTNRSVERA
jgi:hypothetical protein